MLRDVAILFAAVLALSAPFALFVQLSAGLGNATDQMLTYAVREGRRTRITALPSFKPGRLMSVEPPAPNPRIVVRWAPRVDAAERARLAASLGLSDEQLDRPEARTWTYVIEDASTEHLRRIVNDPAVEDTGRIDRSQLRLERPMSVVGRLGRRMPVLRTRVLPDLLSGDNPSAIVFYTLAGLPIAAIAIFCVTGSRVEPRYSRADAACFSSLTALCVVLDVFILREPVGARVGGMAGPAAVLGAWIAARSPGQSRALRRSARIGGIIVLVLAVAALSVLVDWEHTEFLDRSRIASTLREAAVTPTSTALLPTGRVEGLITFIRECTRPDDRVFASWFFPELYTFAQRGFGGAMVVTFGDHWSEPRFQERSVRAFRAKSVPLVVIQTATYGEFRDAYPLLDQYFAEQYRVAGASAFGDPAASRDAYRVLVPRDRRPVRTEPRWGLPCFAP